MKRILACIVALMVCASLVLPVAAEGTFTPSVTYKPAPEIVPVPDPEGKPAMGTTLKGDIEFDYIYEGCLVITSVAEAATSEDIPADARDLLLDVYNKLNSGEMKLPYDKLGSDINAGKMVIRDLFDASFLCGDGSFAVNHPEMLEPEGTVIKLTFNLGVDNEEKVYAMTYVDGEWVPAVKVVNNGDGTVSCTFEQLCPVVFCVEADDGGNGGSGGGSAGTGDPAGDSMTLWIVMAVSSMAAIAVLVYVYRTKISKHS